MARTQIRGKTQIMAGSIDLTRLTNNFLAGTTWNVDTGNGATITGLASPANANDAVNKDYVDTLISSTAKGPDGWDASTGAYPSQYKGNAILEGDPFVATVDGTVDSIQYRVGDMVIAKVDTPSTTSSADWVSVQANIDLASELVPGLIEIADQTETDAGTNDTNAITPLKLATYITNNDLDVTAGSGLVQNGKAFDVSNSDGSLTIGADDVAVNIGNTNGTSLEVSTSGVELSATVTGTRTFSQATGETFTINNADANSATLAVSPDGGVDLAIATVEYVDASGGQLVKVTENSNTGYRLSDANAANYGDIGSSAIDLSHSDGTVDTNRGATGDQAFATGKNTLASGAQSFAAGLNSEAQGGGSVAMGYSAQATGLNDGAVALGYKAGTNGQGAVAIGYQASATNHTSVAIGYGVVEDKVGAVALGQYNTNTADAVLEVGYGADNTSRANVFEVFQDGTATLPGATISEINSRGNTSVATKEYVDDAVSGVDLSSRAGDGLVWDGTNNEFDIASANVAIAVNTDNIELTVGSTNGTSLEVSATGVELAATVTGARTFQDALTAGSTLDVTGAATLSGGTTATGTVTLGTNADEVTLVTGPTGNTDLAVATVKYVKDEIGVLSGDVMYNETPAVTAGSADVILANTPRVDTQRVYLNGVRQVPGSGNDYTISGSTITFEDNLASDDVVLVDYIYD